MSLLGRLQGLDEPKIAVHQFWAGMEEVANGEITVQEFKNYFNLSSDEASDFDWLWGKYTASSNQKEFLRLMHIIFVIAEVSAPGYTTETQIVDRINRIP
jgi:hypothetical protein